MVKTRKKNDSTKIKKNFKEDKLSEEEKENEEKNLNDSTLKLKFNNKKLSRNSPGESEEDPPISNRAILKKNKIYEKKGKKLDVSSIKSKNNSKQTNKKRNDKKKGKKTKSTLIDNNDLSDEDEEFVPQTEKKKKKDLKKNYTSVEKDHHSKLKSTSKTIKEKDEIEERENESEEKPKPENKKKKNKRNKNNIEETNSDQILGKSNIIKCIKETEIEEKSLFDSNTIIVVDEFLPDGDNYQVVIDNDNEFNGIAWYCKLNFSDLKRNNNKFYVIQLLTDKSKNRDYYLFIRWGRVGYEGQTSFKRYASLEEAKKEFLKKHSQKSKTYRELTINYEKIENNNEVTEQKENIGKEKKQKSSLNKHVQSLMKLIYNKKNLDEQILEIGYDTKKLPLGKLGKSTIIQGFEVLKRIEDVLNYKSHEDIYDLSSLYYSFIPHCFGFQNMKNFVIDSLEKLKLKVSNLESLSDIEIATKILDESHNTDHLIDEYYKRLNCRIEILSPKLEIYKLIHDYFANTINKNYENVTIQEIFEIKREDDEQIFNSKILNKMLLWHGSRVTNYVGILSQGLRIAPPEAPVSGYLYGKGIYFADMASKSLNYCYPTNKEGLILLCEVAAGNFSEKFQPDYNSFNLPKGKHSTKAIGDIYPPLESYINHNGIQIPIGEPNNHNGFKYNEYVIYNLNQVKMKYLLRLKWK